MIMSLKNLFKSGSLSSQPLVCEEIESSLDLTIPGANILQGEQDIRKGSISKLKIFTNNVDILPKNQSYLAGSLTELKIRPRPEENSSDEEDEVTIETHSQINTFPTEVELFHAIRIFYLDNNGTYPSGLLTSLKKLDNLEYLTLRHCGLEKLTFATFCAKLTYLNLEHNKITCLPSSVYKLKSLQCLIITQNKITNIDEDITQLRLLKKLDISLNLLTVLPLAVCKLSSLLKLYLSRNRIKSLPEAISSLTVLKLLDLSHNSLTSLPDTIGMLFNLQLLNLNYNKLTALPERICDLNIRDDGLLLSGNPLYKPPVEVCIQGKDSIQGYFDAARTGLSVNCKRLKLVLLGESLAGKDPERWSRASWQTLALRDNSLSLTVFAILDKRNREVWSH